METGEYNRVVAILLKTLGTKANILEACLKDFGRIVAVQRPNGGVPFCNDTEEGVESVRRPPLTLIYPDIWYERTNNKNNVIHISVYFA